ncbi:hypothetical protein ACWGNY_20145 [[Kitasatospora] papulosa]|uniref:hypothetical protein n=1 Tax=[Kitasatospora] papulosa TaxID=1464011 RepID=UPI003630FDB7
MTRRDDEPTFFALDYVAITRDPRTQLVVAIGGDPRAAGVLQTAGGFHSAQSAGCDYTPPAAAPAKTVPPPAFSAAPSARRR